MVEQELADTNETLSEQTCTNQAIQGAKQKLESEMSTLQADCDEMAGEGSLSEEKAQRAMIDAARLADELRAEQEMAQSLEREKRLLEAQVKDMQARVDRGPDQRPEGRQEGHDQDGHSHQGAGVRDGRREQAQRRQPEEPAQV